MPKTKVWQHAKKPDHSYTAGGNVIWYSQSGRIRLLLKKQHKTHYTCKYQIPNNFAIALLGIYHRETKTKFTQRLVQKKMFSMWEMLQMAECSVHKVFLCILPIRATAWVKTSMIFITICWNFKFETYYVYTKRTKLQLGV